MLNVMFLTAILVINGILVVSSDPIVPEQIGCDEGEPIIDNTSPDINITVLPDVFINESSPVTVVCDADFPRFLPPQTNCSLLQTVKIDIHLGTFLIKSCDRSPVSQCIHKINNFFPGLPTTFSCTATNARNECRFKFKEISILGPLTTNRTIGCKKSIAPTIISEIKTSINPGINETTVIPLRINETKFSSTSPPVTLTSKGQTALPQITVEITAAPIHTNSSTDILREIVPSTILSSSFIEIPPITTAVLSITNETTTISSVNVSSTAASLTPSSVNETTVSPPLINETKFSSTSLPAPTTTTFQKAILQTSRILPTTLIELSSITTAVSSAIIATTMSSVNISSKAVSITPSKQYSTTSTTPAMSTTIIPVIKTTSKPPPTDKDDDDDSDSGDDDSDDDDSDSDIDDDSDDDSNSDSDDD